MTYRERLEKKARDRWYKLAYELEYGDYAGLEALAEKIGIMSGNSAFYHFLNKHGDALMSKYGPLPYRFTGSKVLERFMEDSNEL